MKALLCHAKGLGLFVPGNGELFTGCQYNSDMIRGLFRKNIVLVDCLLQSRDTPHIGCQGK